MSWYRFFYFEKLQDVLEEKRKSLFLQVDVIVSKMEEDNYKRGQNRIPAEIFAISERDENEYVRAFLRYDEDIWSTSTDFSLLHC